MKPLAIEVSGLRKLFANKVIIKDLNLKTYQGQIHLLLGPNGAGKSTLIRLLSGLIKADEGTMSIFGLNPENDFKKLRSMMGYLPENNPLNQDLTVLEHLKAIAFLKDIKVKSNHFKETVDCFSLENYLNVIIRKLSKGTAQRVGLALALMGRPPILILDEPTNGLDPKQSSHLQKLFKELVPKSTIFISSHLLAEMSLICDRVSFMVDGKVLLEDDLSNLLVKNKPRLKIKIKAPDVKLVLEKLSVLGLSSYLGDDNYNLEADFEMTAKVAALCVEEKWDLYELVLEKINFEELFIETIKNGV